MYNWSTDTKKLAQNKEQYIIWQLEQMINFGLNNQKLSKKNLLKYWTQLHLDPDKKRYLKFLLDK